MPDAPENPITILSYFVSDFNIQIIVEHLFIVVIDWTAC
jgi:hypothetical protein